MGAWNDVDQKAREQHGLVSRAQLVAAGFVHRSSLAWLQQRGDLTRLHAKVFALRGSVPSWERTAMAGLLIGDETAVVSHESAAWLHRLDGFRTPRVVHVSVDWNGPRQLPGIDFHRRRVVPPAGDVLRGLRVTSLAHTLLDLAEASDDHALELALDSAHRRQWNLEELIDRTVEHVTLERAPHGRRLLALLDARAGSHTDSSLEVEVARVLRAERFPPWVEQRKVFDEDGKYVMRVDFSWPAHRVALHADSFRWHHQRVRVDRDARQRSRLMTLGWRSVVVTDTSLSARAWRDDLRFLLNPQCRLPLRSR